ncbi:uncharacterized protein EI90DRAFT_3034597 [Cantharellus anzutake]|uniref:uncharacterized protein n=1 Tax=Cantharellus anzutake TaxID=1750568 RepID=UPI001905B673|nr:uncharacterized protein EI90DRAFT_3034597 [Cantharellus anzutake]KAF8341606.1 hypothetical protein EI90DRAFT_3034597 [Cantharellus anzutake]
MRSLSPPSVPIDSEYNSSKVTMRFCNALIPVALLPIVAADFHLAVAICAGNYDLEPISGGPDLTLIPSNQDPPGDGICVKVTEPRSEFYQQRIPVGSVIKAAPCGGNITVSDGLDEWSSDDGQRGWCFPVKYGGGIGRRTVCNVDGSKTCVVFDVAFCQSQWCKGPDGSG